MIDDIQSPAFRDAAYRSERFRTAGLLVVTAFMCILSGITALSWPSQHRLVRYLIFLGFWTMSAGFEIVVLLLAQRAQKNNRALPTWFWAIVAMVECSFPTVAIVFLSLDREFIGPYRGLFTPPVLIYFIFIILSTLRLRPVLCLISGLSCSMGYLSVLLWTLHTLPNDPARNVMPMRIYVFYCVILFVAGVLAAGVARQIRQHVMAALTEAETRRKLDRIEYDLRLARSIQMGLLPKNPPNAPGYDIAGWSQPADQTGGDYYDWIELPDGRVLITIADATGHGIGPALLIAACRAYFRAVAMHDDPLEKITQQVDALITRDVQDGRFITAAVALLDGPNNQLSLYSAGHGPIFFYEAANRTVHSFNADQPPLGIALGGEPSNARRLSLLPGDALVLVTDGFFEGTNTAGDMFGPDRLADIIRTSDNSPAETLIAQIRDQSIAFSIGTPQRDDMTAVVVKRPMLR